MMIIRRDAFFAGLLTLSFAGFGCSSKSSSGTPDAGGSSTGTGGSSGGTGGKSGTGGTGTGGKSGTGGTGTGGKSGTGGTGTGGTSGSGAPSVKIDSPANGASVGPTSTYPDYPDVPVAFTIKNFTLMAPGSNMNGKCPAGTCGHLHLLVDGTACNDKTGASPLPYNNAGATSPINAGLDYCPSTAGAHTITLEIHNDDHSAVKDSSGTVISDKINITAAAANEGDAG
jgi:hypothetical protein